MNRTLLAGLLLSAMIVSLAWAAPYDESAEALVGNWDMVTTFQGREIPATMSIALKGGQLVGVWKSEGGEMEMKDIAFKQGTLTFHRTMGDTDQVLSFAGKVEGSTVSGKWETGMGTFDCKGKKAGASEGS